MRIGVLSQWYPPEPVQIPQSVAQGLADRGHEVVVLTAFPNYPSGKVYSGYKQSLRHVEQHGRVTVRRVPVFASHDRSAVRRLGNFASFTTSSLVLGARSVRDVDAWYVYHPPATAAALAVLRSVVGSTPFLLHVQDLWPDSVTESGLVNPRAAAVVRRSVGAWCRVLYRHAAAVVAISDGMRDILVSRGVPQRKIHRLYNWVDESVFVPSPQPAVPADGTTTVLYAGNFGGYQSLDVAIRAAARLPAELGFRLLLVGSGTQDGELRHLANQLNSPNVSITYRVPLDQAGRLAAEADGHLVSLQDLPVFAATIPSKTQAAMAVGRPVLLAVPGESARLVSGAGAGLAVPPGDEAALASAFGRFAAMSHGKRAAMGRAGRALYDGCMSERQGVATIEALLQQATRRQPAWADVTA